jgi:hypothetical protein
MATAVVKKWADFQHYKNRCPPWIKLQKSILDDFDFACLPIASKALAPLLWLLASESVNGEVCIDSDFLTFRLRWSADDIAVGIEGLISKGFLIVASDALAERKQSARLEEREVEERRERGEEKSDGAAAPSSESIILSAYHSILPGCQHISVLNDKRKKRIASAIKLARRVCSEQDWPYAAESFWQAYFGECAKDAWMRGEVPNPKNPNWKQNLDVLIAEDRFAGVMDKAIANRSRT